MAEKCDQHNFGMHLSGRTLHLHLNLLELSQGWQAEVPLVTRTLENAVKREGKRDRINPNRRYLIAIIIANSLVPLNSIVLWSRSKSKIKPNRR